MLDLVYAAIWTAASVALAFQVFEAWRYSQGPVERASQPPPPPLEAAVDGALEPESEIEMARRMR